MIFKFFRLICFSFLFLSLSAFSICAQEEATESDQQIGDFSLAGYEDKGKKAWDLAGKSADIFTEVIKLKDVIGNMYGKDEDVRIIAQKGDFNKAEGMIHLEKDVVITTSSGTRLTTDSLDWDRKKQFVSTDDVVKIKRDNMFTVATGARGEPGLKKVDLQKDVKVDIIPVSQGQAEPDAAEKIVITCDGPLQIDYAVNVATFNNNVKVERQDSVIFSDKMDIYFLSGGGPSQEPQQQGMAAMGSKIDRIVCRGNVKIVRGDNISYSNEAVYAAADKKIVLTGSPKLVLYSAEDFGDALTGN